MEVWRDIPSLPEYQASSLGRVMRIPYTASTPHGGVRTYGGEPHVGQWAEGSGQGRYIFVFRGKTYKVARLVCEAFHGPPPPGKPYCLHEDEDAGNNHQDNLSWGTQKENLNAPKFLLYCKGRTGTNSTHAKRRRHLGTRKAV